MFGLMQRQAAYVVSARSRAELRSSTSRKSCMPVKYGEGELGRVLTGGSWRRETDCILPARPWLRARDEGKFASEAISQTQKSCGEQRSDKHSLRIRFVDGPNSLRFQ
jgi:hypothetical protein